MKRFTMSKDQYTKEDEINDAVKSGELGGEQEETQ